MSYATDRQKFDQERFHIVELDVPRCSRQFGVAPCLATGAACFNTAGTCTYRAALELSELTTYRFCSATAPLPPTATTASGGNATTAVTFDTGISLPFGGAAGGNPDVMIPSLSADPRVTDPTLDLEGGLGVRGKVSISLVDHPFGDDQFNADPYLTSRSYDPLEQGTFWSKFRARDPYFVGRTLRVYDGFVVDGAVRKSDMRRQTFVVENIDVGDGSATITGKDLLKLADNDRAKFPRATNAQLASAISAGDTSLTVSYFGLDLDSALPLAGGKIRIDDEVMSYASRSGGVLSGLVRGVNNTPAASHDAEASVQLCREFNAQAHVIIATLLTEGAGIDPAFLPLSQWAAEIAAEYPSNLNGIITEPTGVQDLLKEICATAQTYLWWDPETQTVQLRVSKKPVVTGSIVTDEANILAGSYKATEKPEMRISQVWVYYGIRNPVTDLEDAANYELLHVRADLPSETPEEYGTQRVRVIYSRWITRNNKTAAVALATKLGQRFGKGVREITVELPLRDLNWGLGDTLGIRHRLTTDATGAPLTVYGQITARAVSNTVSYTALEHPLAAIDGDEGGFTLYPQTTITNTAPAASLRALYDDPAVGRFPPGTIPPPTGVVFIVEAGVVLAGRPGVLVGDWSDLELAAGYPIPLELRIAGSVTGHGGAGGDAGAYQTDGQDGGNAIEAHYPIEIVMVTAESLIGAGGGGGGSHSYVTGDTGSLLFCGGGGGASFGATGSGAHPARPLAALTTGAPGVTLSGGGPSGVKTGSSGAGGALGLPGLVGVKADPSAALTAGGAAGAAIITNGHAVTVTNSVGATVIGGII